MNLQLFKPSFKEFKYSSKPLIMINGDSKNNKSKSSGFRLSSSMFWKKLKINKLTMKIGIKKSTFVMNAVFNKDFRF